MVKLISHIVLALLVAGAAAECDMLKLCNARDAAGDIGKVDCTKPALSSCAVYCNLAKSKYGAATPGAQAKITSKISKACDPITKKNEPHPMKKTDFEKFWNGVCRAAEKATEEKVAAAGAARTADAASTVEAGNTKKLAQKFSFKSLRGSMQVDDVKKCSFCAYWDNLDAWCNKNKGGTGGNCPFAKKCKELNKDKPRDSKTGLCKTGKPDGGEGPAPQADPKTPKSADPSPGSSGCASHSGKEPAKVAACCTDPKCVPTKLGSCLTKENAAGQKAPLVTCPPAAAPAGGDKKPDKKPAGGAAADPCAGMTGKEYSNLSWKKPADHEKKCLCSYPGAGDKPAATCTVAVCGKGERQDYCKVDGGKCVAKGAAAAAGGDAKACDVPDLQQLPAMSAKTKCESSGKCKFVKDGVNATNKKQRQCVPK